MNQRAKDKTMKDKKDMRKDTDELDSLLVKFKRLEISLADKVEQFIEAQEKISEHSKKLTLEIEELKKIKNSVVKAVGKAVEENISQAFPKLLPPLIQGFENKTNAFVESSIKDAQRLKNEINQTVSKASQFISSQKSETTLRRFGIGVAFCFSSLLTALSIFYFFPQYQNVTYGISPSTAEMIVFGETFMENAGQLTPEQRAFFIKKAADRFKVGEKHPQ